MDTTLPAPAVGDMSSDAPAHPTRARFLARLTAWIEYLSGAVLAIDVLVVFVSVIYRYALHEPIELTEDIARGLLVVLVFFGAASVLARSQHMGVEFFRGMLPVLWQSGAMHVASWIVAGVSCAVFLSSLLMMLDSGGQVTSSGFAQWIYISPMVVGSFCMTLFGLANALNGPTRTVFGALVLCLGVSAAVCAWNAALPAHALSPMLLLALGFLTGIALGVPIAFVLAFASLLFFLADPSLPMTVYSQQVIAGSDHFVLLSIPFFVLAGYLMEANGMSSRLVELLVRMFGRVRGGFGLITIISTAFFSGISGSKLADVAAVGGIVMPAVRKTRQDPNEAAGLLACSAVMAEAIPPCVNLIILGFVANISIGGLFMAGLVPAGVLALGLCVLAVCVGTKINPDDAFETRTPMLRLLGGALVAFLMVFMIGRGVISGVATSTEISAFAVIYALVIGGVAFRELTLGSLVRVFVKSGSMAGSILFIVAAATSMSFALTLEQIPQQMAGVMLHLAHNYGSIAFMLIAVVVMIIFGALLEGAPALLIFGPVFVPIASQLGINPLQFGIVLVIAMGFGLFAPPIGLGLFATCGITGTEMKNVARPMLKYLVLLFVGLLVLVCFPSLSLWLPTRLGM